MRSLSAALILALLVALTGALPLRRRPLSYVVSFLGIFVPLCVLLVASHLGNWDGRVVAAAWLGLTAAGAVVVRRRAGIKSSRTVGAVALVMGWAGCNLLLAGWLETNEVGATAAASGLLVSAVIL